MLHDRGAHVAVDFVARIRGQERFDDVDALTHVLREHGISLTLDLVLDHLVGATQPLDELDHAIAIANDSVYGLAAAIWTDDLTTAHRAARALKVLKKRCEQLCQRADRMGATLHQNGA